MIYLFLGEDTSAKDVQIAAIRSKLFQDPQALLFDFENYDAKDLDTDTLQQLLLTLPVLAPKRLILLRQIHKLKSADIQTLLHFCQKPSDHCDVILETPQKTLTGELGKCEAHCRTVQTSKPQRSVFDMTKLIAQRRGAEALKMLHEFYEEGTYPLQIMGALVWFWGKEGKALDKQKFKRGLQALQEADLNIKRSKLNPQYAVEKVVVELVELFGR